MTATIAPPVTDIAFRVEARQLAAACETVARRLARKPTVPVLGGLLLEVADGELAVSAFDYEVATRVVVDAPIGTDGQALVSGRLLSEFVKTFPNKPVDVAVRDGRLVIVCNRITLTLPMMPVDEYPALPVLPPAIGTVDAATFADAVARVFPATDATGQMALPALTGMYLRFVGDRIHVEGTDKYRGAIADIGWAPAHQVGDALVPAVVLAEAAKMMSAGGDVTLHYDGAGSFGLSASVGSVTAPTLAVEWAPLPTYMPARIATPTTVNVADLVAALKRADLVREEATAVRLAFTAGEVSVGATDGEKVAGEPIACQHHGPDLTVGVNPRYLSDGLAALRADVAELHLRDNRKAFLLTPQDDPDYRHLVMPIRPA